VCSSDLKQCVPLAIDVFENVLAARANYAAVKDIG
jgi:hypothetical protein